jgi:urease accessory protein
MDSDPSGRSPRKSSQVAELQLLHLADSALPIGSLAHSFGLESLAYAEILTTGNLAEFLNGYLQESGLMEAVFCRKASRLARGGDRLHFVQRWLEINDHLSARKAARETRAASAALGRTFLVLAAGLGESPLLQEALRVSKESASLIHHSTAFGLAAGAMDLDEDRAVSAFLHQSVASLVSACQRLLPLGQTDATRILWNLKPAIVRAASRSAACAVDNVCCFMPLLDWGAMEHPALLTRLFIS